MIIRYGHFNEANNRGIRTADRLGRFEFSGVWCFNLPRLASLFMPLIFMHIYVWRPSNMSTEVSLFIFLRSILGLIHVLQPTS